MKKIRKILIYMGIILLSILFIFPLVWMIASSTKPEAQIFKDMGTIQAFIPQINVEAYKEVFQRFNLIRYTGNSILYAGLITVGSILVNSLAGFAFANYQFKGKNLVFSLMIALLVIPAETIMISKFSIMKRLNLLNTRYAVIIPMLATPLFIYMFTNFFKDIPSDVLESARIEGANDFQIYWKIMLPMAKPAIASVGTLSFIASWNDYIWPLMVLTDTDTFPLQVAITNINNTHPVFTNQVMAILTISTIPLIIIYVFFQKYLVQGLSSQGTGVK